MDDEIVYGKWLPIYHNGKFKGGKCSRCGKFKKASNIRILYDDYKFCHGCGTKMGKSRPRAIKNK